MVALLPLREHAAHDFNLAGKSRLECLRLWRIRIVDDPLLREDVLYSPSLMSKIVVGVVCEDEDGQVAADGTQMRVKALDVDGAVERAE